MDQQRSSYNGDDDHGGNGSRKPDHASFRRARAHDTSSCRIRFFEDIILFGLPDDGSLRNRSVRSATVVLAIRLRA